MQRYPGSTIAKLKSFRRRGYSIERLMKKFEIPKTSIWHHIHTIKLSEKYSKRLRAGQGSKTRREGEIKRAQEEASHFVPKKIDKATAAMLAAALYWGEGAKRDFNLANSDPNLVRLFMVCMEKLGISPKRFALHVRTYEDLNPDMAIQHWTSITKIPRSNVVRVEVLKGKKGGKLPYGMCRVRLYKGAYQLKFLTAIREHILKLI